MHFWTPPKVRGVQKCTDRHLSVHFWTPPKSARIGTYPCRYIPVDMSKIIDKRLQNLHFPGGPFSGQVFRPCYSERIKNCSSDEIWEHIAWLPRFGTPPESIHHNRNAERPRKSPSRWICQNCRQKTTKSALSSQSLFRTCFSVPTIVNALKIALQMRSGDISPGDLVLEHPLSPSTIRGTQKELQKVPPDGYVKIVDKRLQNLGMRGSRVLPFRLLPSPLSKPVPRKTLTATRNSTTLGPP